MKEITLEIIKKSLYDSEFRELLINNNDSYSKLIDQWINNPNCQCNNELYTKIFENINILRQYYGENIYISNINKFDNIQINNEDETINYWTVFNGSIHEIEDFLNNLGNGIKQIAIARYKDEVTIIVNEPQYN